YYDARSGHWLSQDPLGFAAGDSNLYRYVANDPLGFLDPFGTDRWWFADPNAGYVTYPVWGLWSDLWYLGGSGPSKAQVQAPVAPGFEQRGGDPFPDHPLKMGDEIDGATWEWYNDLWRQARIAIAVTAVEVGPILLPDAELFELMMSEGRAGMK